MAVRWDVHQDELDAVSPAAEFHFFGISVGISGDVAIVGAKGDDDNGGFSGSAYVYRFDGTTWVEEQKLLASDGEAGDTFGDSVSISGEVVVVGATGGDDNGGDFGSAYVFRYDGVTWVEEQKLLPSNGEAGDDFGVSVSTSEGLAIVGAFLHDDNGFSSGAAYVYQLQSCGNIPFLRGDFDGGGRLWLVVFVAPVGRQRGSFFCSRGKPFRFSMLLLGAVGRGERDDRLVAGLGAPKGPRTTGDAGRSPSLRKRAMGSKPAMRPAAKSACGAGASVATDTDFRGGIVIRGFIETDSSENKPGIASLPERPGRGVRAGLAAPESSGRVLDCRLARSRERGYEPMNRFAASVDAQATSPWVAATPAST